MISALVLLLLLLLPIIEIVIIHIVHHCWVLVLHLEELLLLIWLRKITKLSQIEDILILIHMGLLLLLLAIIISGILSLYLVLFNC